MEFLQTNYGDRIPMPPEIASGDEAARDRWVQAQRSRHRQRFITVPAEVRERAAKEKDGAAVIQAFVADHVARNPLPPLREDELAATPSAPPAASPAPASPTGEPLED